MYPVLQRLRQLYAKVPQSGFHDSNTPIAVSLEDNLRYLRSSFQGSADLTLRSIRLTELNAAVITIDNMIDKQVLAEGVLKPLMSERFFGKPERYLDRIRERLLYTAELLEINTYEILENRIMSGFAVILIDGVATGFAIGLQGYASRSVSEPESDIVQRGSKEGFVESVRVNMTMIRRRLKNPALKFETMIVGKKSHTEIALCYLTDMISFEILDKLKERIRQIPLDTVLTAGYLVPFLEEENDYSFFSSVGISERPDTICGKLTEGRIALLVDGVPAALIVPYIFAEHFQSLDDYSNRAYFATFTRILKYAAFLISILLPGVFVSLGTYNPEMFPAIMLNKIASAIASTPLSLTTETILILFIYEIMREAGLRMPQPLGYAVSIVGGLVIGDTAVNAGLIGAPTLMVVAVSAISSYVVPNLYAPSAVLRLIFTLAGGWFGIWGIAVTAAIVLVNLCGKTSFGIPYTTPITPISVVALRDIIVRAGWKTLSKQTEPVQNLPGSNVKGDASPRG